MTQYCVVAADSSINVASCFLLFDIYRRSASVFMPTDCQHVYICTSAFRICSWFNWRFCSHNYVNVVLCTYVYDLLRLPLLLLQFGIKLLLMAMERYGHPPLQCIKHEPVAHM